MLSGFKNTLPIFAAFKGVINTNPTATKRRTKHPLLHIFLGRDSRGGSSTCSHFP